MARLKTDWILFSATLALVGFGLVMVYSASSAAAELRYHVPSYHFALRQLIWAVAAFVALMYLKKQDYRLLNTPAWAFAALGIVVALLVAVYIADPRTHRWFRLGPIGSIQPSEFAKPALAVFLAFFIHRRRSLINDKHTLRPAAMAVVMLAVTVVIADLGTAVVLVATAITVFWVAGLERRYLLMVVAIGMFLGLAAVASKGYRLARVVAYVDPEYKILDTIDRNGYVKGYIQRSGRSGDPGYQALQSRIAVGTGGVLGAGLMQGRQKLLYLPEAHTDFIYAVVGEELGLWGCLAVIGGFLVVLWRGTRLFMLAHDDFGKYLALGVTVSIVLQALINISVVLDLGPTKGIPLPMISAGGSSLLATLTQLGLLLSVSEHAA